MYTAKKMPFNKAVALINKLITAESILIPRGAVFVFAATNGFTPAVQSVHLRYFSIYLYYNMNFFKEIGRAVDKLNQVGKATHPSNFLPKKSDPLTELIRSCTYTDDVKYAIEKSVRQYLGVFTNYKVDLLQYVEQGQQRRYIQLKGELIISNRGKIPVNIMYPPTFPKLPPFVRIINNNPQQNTHTQLYAALQSKSDSKSYVVNPIVEQAKDWNAGRSVVQLMVEVNNIICTNFPFQKIQKPQYSSQWGNQPNYSNYANKNQYNSQFNQSQNSGWNQQKQPPIPFKPVNIAQISAKSQMLVGTQKKKLQQMKMKHHVVLEKLQQLELVNSSLQSESILLENENQKMIKYIQLHENDQIKNGFNDVVRPSDPRSQQILNLICSIKAREDAIHFLQHRFNEEQLSLQDFMKQLRKFEQIKFQEKVLLNKCLAGISNIIQ